LYVMITSRFRLRNDSIYAGWIYRYAFGGYNISEEFDLVLKEDVFAKFSV